MIIVWKNQVLNGKMHIAWGVQSQDGKTHFRFYPTPSQEVWEAFFVGLVEGLDLSGVNIDEIKEIE